MVKSVRQHKYFIFLIIILVFQVTTSFGQKPSDKLIKEKVDILLSSLKNSDTTLFKSLFIKIISECNTDKLNRFIFDSKFQNCKIELDKVIKQSIPISKIDISEEKWDANNRVDKNLKEVYQIKVDFKSQGKVNKGLDFYFFKLNGSWFMDIELSVYTQTYN